MLKIGLFQETIWLVLLRTCEVGGLSIIKRLVCQGGVWFVLSSLRPLIIQFDKINVHRRFCLNLWPEYRRGSPLPDAKEPQSKSSSSARSFIFPYFFVSLFSLSFSPLSFESPVAPLVLSFFSSLPLTSSFFASLSSCCCLF